MFVVIYEPETDILLYQRRMGPNEKLDLDKLIDWYAQTIDRDIDHEPTGHIPNCCGNIRIEFRPRRDIGWHIWSGRSYYFKRDDE
jgi:hypothetical protein